MTIFSHIMPNITHGDRVDHEPIGSFCTECGEYVLKCAADSHKKECANNKVNWLIQDGAFLKGKKLVHVVKFISPTTYTHEGTVLMRCGLKGRPFHFDKINVAELKLPWQTCKVCQKAKGRRRHCLY